MPTGAEEARAELVRRYLRCHGPSTPAQFAAWCGIGRADARRSLSAESAGTLEIGKGAYLLADDVDVLASAADGVSLADPSVRLVPPRDPWLFDRDRSTLVPDDALRRRVWTANPVDGLVLVDGEGVASWRAKKQAGGVMRIVVESSHALDPAVVDVVREEAEAIAALRLCRSVDVVIG
jgi:hypothetical protein